MVGKQLNSKSSKELMDGSCSKKCIQSIKLLFFIGPPRKMKQNGFYFELAQTKGTETQSQRHVGDWRHLTEYWKNHCKAQRYFF